MLSEKSARRSMDKIKQFGKIIDLRIGEKVKWTDEVRNLGQLDYIHVRRYWVKQCCHSTDESVPEKIKKETY